MSAPLVSRTLLLCVLAAGAPPISRAVPTEDYVSYSGTATLRHGARVLYGERHVLEYRAGRLAERVVLYTCADGTPFARKTVSYVDPTAPDFSLEDVSTGLQEGVRTAAGGRLVFFRPNHRESDKSAPLPPTPGLVIDAGFDDFVRAHWRTLLAGRPLRFPFLVPSRLGDIGFQVQHQRSDLLEGVPVEVFRLKLSGIWGWLLSGIDVSYGTADQVLMRYDGLSDLRDAANDNYAVIVNFHPRDRAPGSAAAMAAARAVRLAPCR